MRIMVVDDEPLPRRRIARLLRECGCEVCGEWEDVQELLGALASGPRPDAVFLDIEMPGGTGMEAMAEIRELPDPPAVVFVTAFPEHAAQAFDADAVDYLLKPVYKDRLERALDRLRRKGPAAPPSASEPAAAPSAPAPAAAAAPSPGRFPAKAGGGHVFLELRKVTHFEFENQAVWAWSGGHRFRTPWDSLVEVEAAFPDAGMMRIQRNVLLRPEAVIGHRSLPNGRAMVRLPEGLELEVSRTMTPKLRARLGL